MDRWTREHTENEGGGDEAAVAARDGGAASAIHIAFPFLTLLLMLAFYFLQKAQPIKNQTTSIIWAFWGEGS